MRRLTTLFLLLGCVTLGAAKGQPLTEQALANVEAFTRLLGYVQYFYPSDQAADAEWEAFAISHIERVERARTPGELAATLRTLFRPYAPALQVQPAAKPFQKFQTATDVGDAVSMWVYLPTNGGSKNRYAQGERLRLRLKEGRPPVHAFYSGGTLYGGGDAQLRLPVPGPEVPQVFDLGGGVHVAFPLTLYVGQNGTLPYAPSPRPLTVASSSPDDRAFRLATVALTWNFFQHFFAYWDVVETDWRASLRTALQKAATDSDGYAFFVTLERLLDGLEDGHSVLYHLEFGTAGGAPAPFTADLVEGQLVVTTVTPDNPTSVRLGDVLRKVDGRPAQEVLNDELGHVSGVGQWGHYLALRRMLASRDGRPLTVEIKPYRGGKPYVLEVPTANVNATRLRETRPPEIARLAPGILYVDLTRVEDARFGDVLPLLADANGLVFDLRGYPGEFAKRLLNHLTDQPLDLAPLSLPVVTRPDHRKMQFLPTRNIWAVPLEPRLTDNFVFITNANGTYSAAESVLGILEGYDLGERVGQPTAGANGTSASLELPGGYSIRWTGQRVTKFDGSPLFTVGVTPTILADRTRSGVAAGRDELLERAFQTVSSRSANAMNVRAVPLPPLPLPPFTLVSFTDMEAGFRAVRPLEWRRFTGGIYARLEKTNDRAQFFFRTNNGTRETLLARVLEETDLTEARFEPPFDLKMGALDWQVTPFDFRAGYHHIQGAVATARTDQRSFLVYFQGVPGEYKKLYEQLLTPVLQAFEVISE